MKNAALTHFFLLLLLLPFGGCRSPDELNEIISAQVFVIGVDEDQWVELEIDERIVATESNASANLLQFSLALEPGIHEGTITVFELERGERHRGDDDEWRRPEDDEIEEFRCGEFSIEIPQQVNPANPVSIAIVVEDLAPCDDDDLDEERDRPAGNNARNAPADGPDVDDEPGENGEADNGAGANDPDDEHVDPGDADDDDFGPNDAGNENADEDEDDDDDDEDGYEDYHEDEDPNSDA
jgi:hypothetical protein